jgi:polyphosphate kinase
MAKRPKPEYTTDYYINRELSWLKFNARVLEEAADRTNPLLERLKFLSIFSSNLDEFFEVRVAGLHQQVESGVEPQDFGADGMSPNEQLEGIDVRAHELVAEQYRLLRQEVFPELTAAGIQRVRYPELTYDERKVVESLFHGSIYPVLTPLAIDPGHPFPHVHNKSLNIALLAKDSGNGDQDWHLAVVQVPAVLDRVVVVSRGEAGLRYILLEDIVAEHLDELFGGFTVESNAVFRVTRNTDLSIQEEEAEDLLETIEESLRQRLRSDPVRLEIEADADPAFTDLLMQALELDACDVYRVDGPVDLTAMMKLHALDGFRGLKDEPLVPRVAAAFAQERDFFEVVRDQDVLVHLPYESFGSVQDFIERAADDPAVLAIKMTLYRTSAPSTIITALGRAAQNGKQVTALVELRARFDEQNNIVWSRALEQAGVHVVYGVVGLKTHCKAALVVRREPEGIRRYLHLATGNYNQVTSRIYTDLGLFTSDPEFGEDASALFNLLTGYSRGHHWNRLLVAPDELRERVVELIEREREHAEAGKPARIIVKMNALVEASVIDALYRASQSGVQIDLIIRGICCLRPGLPGFSENIRVISIVDKFLEHTRVFYFENAADPELFLGSADWMPRNFFRRIEVMFPVVQEKLMRRIVDEVLEAALADNVKARVLQSDGTYERLLPEPGEEPVRSQTRLQGIAREAAQLTKTSGEILVPFQARPTPRQSGSERAPTPA